MILVDTSIWIDYLNGRLGTTLRDKDLFSFATCGPVIQEVLQGLKSQQAAIAFQWSFLALPVLGDPIAVETFKAAASIYREGCIKGYTIRSSVDCLIAAIAIENQVPVWHQDRDFEVLTKFTSLQIHYR